MRTRTLSGAAMMAGVVGYPVTHSLSPALHGAWIAAAGLDAIYAPFQPEDARFETAVRGLQAAGLRGVNVTLPFKERALRLADEADEAAQAAGAANLLLFQENGRIEARNTDGIGLLAAFREQAPSTTLTAGPVVILGAGGAARGAAAALRLAGCRQLRFVNRTLQRAQTLSEQCDGQAYSLDRAEMAFDSAVAIINATSAGLSDDKRVSWPLDGAPQSCAVMDMVYKPLRTPLLDHATARGMPTVDGLAMLIGQARPSFEALFGAPPSAALDVRALLLERLE